MPVTNKDGEAIKKAMVRGTISYLESQGLPVNKSAIFRHFQLSRSQGYAALSPSPITPSKSQDPEWEETRGRPSKLSQGDQLKMERILWDDLYANMNLNWAGLARIAGVDAACNPRTLHRAMGTLSYRLCLQCRNSSVQKKSRERRVEHARKMLEMLPQAAEWRKVRFSGELHFGFGLHGMVRLLPRPGEGTCAECKVPHESGTIRDVRRVHVWAAAGHDFKNELVFYDDDVSGNGQGILSMNDYKDKVLDKSVRGWLGRAAHHGDFILEEDADVYAHGSASRSNTVQQWKDSKGLRWQFGCPESPDLNLLDSIWPTGKQWLLPQPLENWEEKTLRDAVENIWLDLDQEKVNNWVGMMVERLRSVVATEGKIAPW
ncbi:hypothetical protein K4F52_001492 [Lecanicillium sp. MT-2017a]|nr:hypothetical protein K4F52_001492 [Lecanicillium sp. MT-2017a]